MRWLICGTIPLPSLGLVVSDAVVYPAPASGLPDFSHLLLKAQNGSVITLPVNRGTAALIAAFSLTAQAAGLESPRVLVAGDDGRGGGSRLVYKFLHNNIGNFAGWGITFHYFLPDIDWHNRLLIALDDVAPRPLLCADAGFLYAAKMSGYAASYDL
ncbi:MAG: sugar kinase, partial [Deltaproteobacteria bacterium]|nr:sugar kinase [Deltaproteobacteria bacterium]